MKIQQIKDRLYVKKPDKVDKHLNNIVNRFYTKPENTEGITEAVILEAINRMKQDIIGTTDLIVTSVNDQIGKVYLNANDVGAEPVIERKSAFNKEFGTSKGDVCEGNDPRLANNRHPTTHGHTGSEITDLDTLLEDAENAAYATAKQYIDQKIEEFETTSDFELDEETIRLLALKVSTNVFDNHLMDYSTHFSDGEKSAIIASIDSKSPLEHTHGNLYYTKTETEIVVADIITESTGSTDEIKTSLDNHKLNKNNPHEITKEQIDLGNVLDATQATKEEFDNHAFDSIVHVTQGEKILWNAKMDGAEEGEIPLTSATGVLRSELQNIIPYQLIAKGTATLTMENPTDTYVSATIDLSGYGLEKPPTVLATVTLPDGKLSQLPYIKERITATNSFSPFRIKDLRATVGQEYIYPNLSSEENTIQFKLIVKVTSDSISSATIEFIRSKTYADEVDAISSVVVDYCITINEDMVTEEPEEPIEGPEEP